MTSKRRAERLAEQQLARQRAAAREHARALAIELGRGQPRAPFDPMNAGVVLWPNETAYRQVPLWLTAFDHGHWAAPSWTTVLVTDQRLLCRFASGSLASLPWNGLVGLNIDLGSDRVTLDHGDGQPVALSGPDTPTIAVASVAFLYGIDALLQHPALDGLRSVSRQAGDTS